MVNYRLRWSGPSSHKIYLWTVRNSWTHVIYFKYITIMQISPNWFPSAAVHRFVRYIVDCCCSYLFSCKFCSIIERRAYKSIWQGNCGQLTAAFCGGTVILQSKSSVQVQNIHQIFSRTNHMAKWMDIVVKVDGINQYYNILFCCGFLLTTKYT